MMTPTIVLRMKYFAVNALVYASAAARWRGCVYVLQSAFLLLSLFAFFRPPTIVHKYETTVLGNR